LLNGGAAAGASHLGEAETPSGSSAAIGEHADTATSTTPSDVEPPPANDNEPDVDETAADTLLVESAPAEEPAPEIEATNDNQPADGLPVTGTDD
jgi:hypothetical protein